MSSGGEDRGRRPEAPVEESSLIRVLKVFASVALTLAIVGLVALIFAPKDAGTLTLYGLVIGVNLLIFLAFFPVARWLRRLER